MDTTSVIRFKRLPDGTAYEKKRYEVYADDVLLGQVYTAEVAHDRGPKGARYVTSRTYSDRWFVRGTDGRRVSRAGQDTRIRAVALLLEKALDLSFTDARKLAETGREYHKSEIA